MDRSIRKNISKIEISSVLEEIEKDSPKREKLRADLIPKIFDPNHESCLLLRSEIRTLSKLKEKIQSIIKDEEKVQAVIRLFKIDSDLQMPINLLNLFKNQEPLALFVGAGVSRLLEIPLWYELAKKAVDHLVSENYINYGEKLRLQDYSPKQIISVFEGIISNKEEQEKFYSENFKAEIKPDNPYEILCDLEKAYQSPLIKVTSNIDNCWEKAFQEKEKTINESDNSNSPDHVKSLTPLASGFNSDLEFNEKYLYKIHGCINDLSQKVMTSREYIERYREDKGLKGFLKNLFQKYTVLFVGVGMQEFEILEHCLGNRSAPPKHFSFVDTRFGEENLLRVRNNYFKDIGVQTIPYYLDFQDYNRLILILKNWVDQIRFAMGTPFYNDAKLIDEVL